MQILPLAEIYSEKQINHLTGEFLKNSFSITEIRNNVFLYCMGEWYGLIRNNQLAAFLHLTPQHINNKKYLNVALIYVVPKFRKTSVLSWILYAVKELVSDPVIADGAIFKDGIELIAALQKHKVMNVRSLNKVTGEISALTEPISNIDYCYLLKESGLKFGKNYFADLPFDSEIVWFNWFDDF